MARPQKKSPSRKRRSIREIAEHADRILKDALQREREYKRQGMRSVTISRAELIQKLTGKTAHSPFLTQLSMNYPVRGSTFSLTFGLMNPDPFPYEEDNLGICYCWSDAGGVTDPGNALLRADPSVGVQQVTIGTLNGAPMPYFLNSQHFVPLTFRLGPADLNYFLYLPDAFAESVLLTRGTLRFVVT